MKKPIPFKDIGECVRQLMDLASKNGANSVSMPDEYVSVFHFICYPEEYKLEIPLKQRIEKKLRSLQIGGCTCGTKIPDINYHTDRCTYRVASEIAELVRQLDETN